MKPLVPIIITDDMKVAAERVARSYDYWMISEKTLTPAHAIKLPHGQIVRRPQFAALNTAKQNYITDVEALREAAFNVNPSYRGYNIIPITLRERMHFDGEMSKLIEDQAPSFIRHRKRTHMVYEALAEVPGLPPRP